MVRHPTWSIFDGPIIHSNDGINQLRSHRAQSPLQFHAARLFQEEPVSLHRRFSCFWWTGVMFNYCINSVSWIRFLCFHRSEALKLQSASNGDEFVSVIAATDMRKWNTGNETIKYTYRAERLPGYRGGKLRRWRMLELVHAVMRLQSSEAGLRAEHIPCLPGRGCDIKPSSTHNGCSSCPRQFEALSSWK